MKNKVELLSPAGSYEGMQAAYAAGADAVYLGGQKFGARAYARNFSDTELLSAIDYAHINGKKLYLTLNTLLKESEMQEELVPYLTPLYEQGLDGVIVQDMGILSFLRKFYPELPVHASTQMTVTSLEGVEFLKRQGVRRVVTARELSLEEVSYIAKNTDVEIESFVHGAICYCYSGQCLMSSMLGGRSGNRGRCAQPCRLPYENEKGKKAYYLSLRDMCTLQILPKIIDAGIRSLKIEGRMKSPEYTAGVTSIYRKYLDHPTEEPDPADLELLQKLYSRSGSDTGYYFRRNGREMLTLQKPCYERDLHAAGTEQVMTEPEKIRIAGEAVFRIGEPAMLTAALNGKDCRASVYGEIVSAAQNRPADPEEVRKRLKKTGNTPYVFERISIDLDENCYISVKGLNELRRDALGKLKEQILAGYRRKADHGEMISAACCEPNMMELSGDDIKYSVLVSTEEQLDAVLHKKYDRNVTRIYLERDLWELAGKTDHLSTEYFLALPHILRKSDVAGIRDDLTDILSYADGVLIRNLESYEILKELGYEGNIVTDANLYTWNREARAFWKVQGVSEDTAPLELNRKELMKRGLMGTEMIIYGYVPLMVTAGCVQKTMDGCRKKTGIRFLKDRYHTVFPVLNRCKECYNIIYNSVPICLFKEMDGISGMHPEHLRLIFTLESGEETLRILRGVCGESYTKGHYARGVE